MGLLGLGKKKEVVPDEQLTPLELLKRRCSALSDELGTWKRDLKEARSTFAKAQKRYESNVKERSKAAKKAADRQLVAALPWKGLMVFDDHLSVGRSKHLLTPTTDAVVDSAGNISVTRRHTLTRFALIGPLSLFTPKKTDHDKRQLVLYIEGDDWVEVVELNSDKVAEAKRVAGAINTAAKTVRETLRKRRQAILDANSAVESACAQIEEMEAAKSRIQEAWSNSGNVQRLVTEIEELADQLSEDEKLQRKARSGANSARTEIEASPNLPSITNMSPSTQPLDELDDHLQALEETEPALQTAPSGDNDVLGQISKLGELHAAGVITDDEFEKKKTELLERL